MTTEKSLSRYILVVLSVSVVLTALIIVALNAYVTNKKLSDPNNQSFLGTAMSSFSYEDGYKDGYNAAREKFYIAPEEITLITGTVTNIDNNSLTIVSEDLDTNEIVDGVSNERIVDIIESTTIVRREDKSQDVIDAEMQAWINSDTDGTTPPPEAFEETSASMQDIEVGSTITVYAPTDIRLEAEFTADKIVLE